MSARDASAAAQEHVVDVFLEDRTFRWGWQCFTCSDEIGGFLAMVTAETSAQQHRTVETIPAGDES